MSHLSDAQVALQLEELNGWSHEGQFIVKTYVFDNFIEAMSFMNQVAFYAVRLKHHPEWKNTYNKVSVQLTTHDVNGITSNDIRLAKRMEQVFQPIKIETTEAP